MKVVNDGLHKYPNGLPKHLETATGIIQREWFKVSKIMGSLDKKSCFFFAFIVNKLSLNKTYIKQLVFSQVDKFNHDFQTFSKAIPIRRALLMLKPGGTFLFLKKLAILKSFVCRSVFSIEYLTNAESGNFKYCVAIYLYIYVARDGLSHCYTLFAVRIEPKPVLRYPSIRTRLSSYLNANYGHFKISFFQRILENNGSFLAAKRV